MAKGWVQSYAPGVPPEIEVEPISVAQCLSRTSGRFPENAALHFHGTTISYGRLDEMAEIAATGLVERLGVRPGDRVSMLLPNLVEMVVAVHAAWRVGAQVVMNNPLYTDPELIHQFNDSDSKYLFALDALVPRMIKLRDVTGIKKIVSCHVRDYLPSALQNLVPSVETPDAPDVHEFMDLLNDGKPRAGRSGPAIDDTAVIMYTGGTTGVSKGVQITHRNLSANCQQMRAWIPQFQDGAETVVGCLPFFHSFGLQGVMNLAVYSGWANILVPKPEPKTILDAIQGYKATYLPAVPTIYTGLLNYPSFKDYDLSSLTTCFSGGAPLPLETIRAFKDFAGIDICEAYGLSETCTCTHMNPVGGKTKAGSIGLPVSGTDAKLVDVADYTKEITTIGEAGELCLKGPQIMKGYINRPDETAAAIRDGWLLTGDIAVMDEEGYFFIVDRKKDMIITGGFNVYPRDVDEVLFTHPKILEACVIGVPDDYAGERVKAFVVLKEGQTATAEEIIDFCKERLTKYKVPKYVEFVSSLPKSAIGKILRKELRKMELEKRKAS